MNHAGSNDFKTFPEDLCCYKPLLNWKNYPLLSVQEGFSFFEISFEFAWKVLKDYQEEDFSITSPRDAIKTAYQYQLIGNGMARSPEGQKFNSTHLSRGNRSNRRAKNKVDVSPDLKGFSSKFYTETNQIMKANFGLTSAELEELNSIIQSFHEIESVMIFGSRAKGTFKPGSDVDMVISGDKLDHSVVTLLSNQLNEETTFPYFFDILDLNTIKSEEMLAHIAQHGRKIELKKGVNA